MFDNQLQLVTCIFADGTKKLKCWYCSAAIVQPSFIVTQHTMECALEFGRKIGLGPDLVRCVHEGGALVTENYALVVLRVCSILLTLSEGLQSSFSS